MRPAIATIGLLFVSGLATLAQEPSTPPVDAGGLNRYLLERIAALETRVAELELRLARADTPAPQSYAPGEPQGDVTTTHRDASGLPYGPTYPTPSSRDAIPRTPSDRVPDNWRRHEFNGHYYYVIPVSRWQPGTTQPRSPLQLPAQTFPSNGDLPVRANANR